MKYFITLLLLFPALFSAAQGKLIMNGATIQIRNGAYLVIDNNSSGAFLMMAPGGGIQMTDAASRLRWRIGTATGNFTVPFVEGTEAIPLSFSPTGASGSGYFDLATYHTPTWKNSDFLPPGVTHINSAGVDRSKYVIDRFWLVAPQGYTTKPDLNNLSFGYSDVEWTATGNNITEPLLKAQRWNPGANAWGDLPPMGTVNTAANTVTVPSVTGTQVFDWWTLVSSDFPLPVQLVSFTAQAVANSRVQTTWKTSFEQHTSHFVVERSKNGTAFAPVGVVTAAGNAPTGHAYALIDPAPFTGASFYRLRIVDVDSSFKYSAIVPVMLTAPDAVRVYPNPATDKVTIELGDFRPDALLLTDGSGKLVARYSPSGNIISIDVSLLPPAVYWLRMTGNGNSKSFRILKVAR